MAGRHAGAARRRRLGVVPLMAAAARPPDRADGLVRVVVSVRTTSTTRMSFRDRGHDHLSRRALVRRRPVAGHPPIGRCRRHPAVCDRSSGRQPPPRRPGRPVDRIRWSASARRASAGGDGAPAVRSAYGEECRSRAVRRGLPALLRRAPGRRPYPTGSVDDWTLLALRGGIEVLDRPGHRTPTARWLGAGRATNVGIRLTPPLGVDLQGLSSQDEVVRAMSWLRVLDGRTAPSSTRTAPGGRAGRVIHKDGLLPLVQPPSPDRRRGSSTNDEFDP